MPALTSLVNPNSAVVVNTSNQPIPTTVSDATAALEDIVFYLKKLVKMSESSAVVDTAQRQRVVLDTGITFSSTQGVFVRQADNNVVFSPNQNSVAIWATIPEFWKFVEAARQNYQLSIRSNLEFT